jgi:exo-1,4-beta-D-glucosaminidase
MNRFKSGVLCLFSLPSIRLLPAACLLAAVAFLSPAAAAQEITLHDGWSVQSSAKVNGGGEKVSAPAFDVTGWYSTTVPKTVFAVLVENGLYKEPYFGMNLRSVPGVEYPIGKEFSNIEMPANSPYAVPWWYRTEFTVPETFQGKTVWLAFRGINYRAEIWINGKKLAGSDEAVGAFRRYQFNVTSFVHPGAKNVLALAISAPHAGELGITFVDWNPAPPDKDMGIWQEVVLSESGPVAVRHPFVDTRLDLPAATKAHLTVRAQLQNTSSAPVIGKLMGNIDGGPEPITFSEPISLSANEARDIVVTPEAVAALNVENPRLWWPFQMGDPYLHKLTLQFVSDHGETSDTQSISFGMVQIDSELTPEGYKLFKINGKPILIRGAGYTPDLMLRSNDSRRAAEFRFVKEMGLNTIRLEGKLEDEAFFERADREGLLVMLGWCCCDAWEKWNKWGDENKRVSVDALRDQILRLRKHPSVLVWLNGSDNPPPAEREQAYLNVEKAAFWPKPTLSSATDKNAEFSGHSGVKMSGPYDYVTPNYWLTDTKAGGAYGFNTETSPGPAVPPLEELQSMFPPEKLWPMNEFWDYHAGGGVFKDIHLYANALEGRYGTAKDAADFAWKSQAMTYEGQRAMFEAYGRNKYKTTGIIQWMLNNSWPGIIWHLYDYSLRPAGGYFGTKKALEPVHVQFSYDDRSVAVVNGTQQAQQGLRVVAKLYNVAAKEIFTREDKLDVAADGVSKTLAIPEPAAAGNTYFLNLQLYGAGGDLLSRNFYWLSSKPDVLNFSKTDWYFTPITSYADFTALQSLPKVSVAASLKLQHAAEETAGQIVVENKGTSVAFLTRLRLLNGKGGTEILPVFWDDNYLFLLPGEKRQISVRIRNTDLSGAKPVLALDGFNVAPITVE